MAGAEKPRSRRPLADGDERLDVLGQVHRGAVGFSVIDRGPSGRRGEFIRIDDAVVANQPRIGTGRGIAGHARRLASR